MSLAAWMPSSLRLRSIRRLLAAAARSSADCAHPIMRIASVQNVLKVCCRFGQRGLAKRESQLGKRGGSRNCARLYVRTKATATANRGRVCRWLDDRARKHRNTGEGGLSTEREVQLGGLCCCHTHTHTYTTKTLQHNTAFHTAKRGELAHTNSHTHSHTATQKRLVC